MSDRDIAAVMVTIDRSPGVNYLAETLANLGRDSWGDRLVSFDLYDSGGPSCPHWVRGTLPGTTLKVPTLVSRIGHLWPDRPVCPNRNVAGALRGGSEVDVPWVLFLEDDIDVCADFFDSVGAWLDDHAREDRRLYAFGANYRWVEEAMAEGRAAADYPLGQFYGTQAIALRSEDAASLSAYLVEHCYDRTEDGTCYDLLMADWARQTWPEIRHFLASAPSLIQHIGRTSSIRPRAETHTFPSWPGREWSYLERRAA